MHITLKSFYSFYYNTNKKACKLKLSQITIYGFNTVTAIQYIDGRLLEFFEGDDLSGDSFILLVWVELGVIFCIFE